MDINQIRSERISPYASAKVMADHFPDIDNEQMFDDADVDSVELSMHAGALCLYAATLLTMVHEYAPESIECDLKPRENALFEAIRQTPKYDEFSDEQISTMAHNLALKDIRNSFAHGNFEINFDIYSKRLLFVLKPKRKDFVVDAPIVISKDSLFRANRDHLGKVAVKLSAGFNKNFKYDIDAHLGDNFRVLVLPADMLRLAENYLDKKIKSYEKYKPTENRYGPLYYPLLVSQMTYDQSDYYNMFNKDSSIFEKISHIRNAISHNGIKFDNKTFDVSHTDRNDVTVSTIEKSVHMLKLARDHKNLILYCEERDLSADGLQLLTNSVKEFFDTLFVQGGYEQEFPNSSVSNLENKEVTK